MSIAPTADIVHLWTDSGTPTRLVWQQRRYRVVAAEPIRATVSHDALTHPAERLIGWSLVVAADLDHADVRVMQVRPTGREWLLADVDPA
ncbi:hypothetical protein A0130_09880 [Leifsonia xyli]|uniref:hypothetical protein n=1 Tax=Leifsonia xyli TaxID=1575 RepID=UPI0007CDEC35|nr:hypothetical protein A0130_09880 [Leifsonia xyli]